eukprot:4433334-Pyramimonas_sp.AAC.1
MVELDVDEVVQVLMRLELVKDKAAAACVSKVWRRASQQPAVWERLSLDGIKAGAVTEERVEALLRRAGTALEAFEAGFAGPLSRPGAKEVTRVSRSRPCCG